MVREREEKDQHQDGQLNQNERRPQAVSARPTPGLAARSADLKREGVHSTRRGRRHFKIANKPLRLLRLTRSA
ncbi:hypothetical protein EVAR_7391_1 [Eumeta japonica]|uniref:Uncharacterized protein n=1 Tax=Eumeta variegata TaxID=151549 RepID=A0A4C1V730_EUMVA|nr:hypothetical protein EVAR_7391_1 [Eumeta japonica]